MDIIIAGAGRVGFRLAKSLSEKHNVIIMDKNENALGKIQESVDVLTIPGDVEDPKSYESLSNRTIDIFIAVTDADEINLISSIRNNTLVKYALLLADAGLDVPEIESNVLNVNSSIRIPLPVSEITSTIMVTVQRHIIKNRGSI